MINFSSHLSFSSYPSPSIRCAQSGHRKRPNVTEMLYRWTEKHLKITIFNLPVVCRFVSLIFVLGFFFCRYAPNKYTTNIMTQQENGRTNLIYPFQIGNNWSMDIMQARDPPTFVCVLCLLLFVHTKTLFAISFVSALFSLFFPHAGISYLTDATCWRGGQTQTATITMKTMKIRTTSRLVVVCNVHASAIFWHGNHIRPKFVRLCFCFFFFFYFCLNLFSLSANHLWFINLLGRFVFMVFPNFSRSFNEFWAHRIKESPVCNKKFSPLSSTSISITSYDEIKHGNNCLRFDNGHKTIWCDPAKVMRNKTCVRHLISVRRNTTIGATMWFQKAINTQNFIFLKHWALCVLRRHMVTNYFIFFQISVYIGPHWNRYWANGAILLANENDKY